METNSKIIASKKKILSKQRRAKSSPEIYINFQSDLTGQSQKWRVVNRFTARFRREGTHTTPKAAHNPDYGVP